MSNNKLIAEFMGYPPMTDAVDDRTIAYDVGGSIMNINNTHNENDDNVFHPDDMKFHISWDWLIPVIEKIECTHDDKGDCFNVMMEAFECTISGLGLTLCLNGHTKMDATYKAVVEFIKEYNK